MASGAYRTEASERDAQDEADRLSGCQARVREVRLTREIVEPRERKEDAILQRRVEATELARVVVEGTVSRLIVELDVELDPEIAAVSRRLDEFAGTAPYDGRAAAQLLSVGMAQEVVIDARTEVV